MSLELAVGSTATAWAATATAQKNIAYLKNGAGYAPSASFATRISFL
jgi:hypothetical protein